MLVSPSLLAADFGNIEREMEWLNRSSADMLHLDVMDGVFVPNLSFGFPVMRAVARLCQRPLDVHLMVIEPEKYLDRVAELPGVRYFNFHYEATFHRHELLERVRAKGLGTGMTIRPETAVEILEPFLPQLDLVLLMSVHPGFGGQKFITQTLDKVRRLRSLIDACGASTLIEVDGGVNSDTGRQLAEAGTDILVAGSYLFRAQDPVAATASLKAL